MNKPKNMPAALSGVLGMMTVPVQEWTGISDLRTGLKAGTIFPELDKPFYMGGVKLG